MRRDLELARGGVAQRQARFVFGARAFEDVAQAGTGRREAHGRRRDTDEGRDDEGTQGYAERGGRDVHEPEREDRGEAQKQEIVERVPREAAAQALHPVSLRPLEPLRAGIAREHEEDRRADGGADDGRCRAGGGAEHHAARRREKRRAGHAQDTDEHVEERVGAEEQSRVERDHGVKTVVQRRDRLEADGRDPPAPGRDGKADQEQHERAEAPDEAPPACGLSQPRARESRTGFARHGRGQGRALLQSFGRSCGHTGSKLVRGHSRPTTRGTGCRRSVIVRDNLQIPCGGAVSSEVDPAREGLIASASAATGGYARDGCGPIRMP